MADERTEAQANQGAVLRAGVSEPYFTKPTQQIDLEQRLEAGELDADNPRSFAVEDNDLSGYVGVNPEYMTYADDTHKPLVGEDGAEAVVEYALRAAPAGVEGQVSEPVKTDDDENGEEPREGRVPATGPAELSGVAEAAADAPESGGSGRRRASRD